MTSAVYYLIGLLNYLVRMKCIYLDLLRQYLVRELFRYYIFCCAKEAEK